MDDRTGVGIDSQNEEMISDATEVIRWYQYQIAVKTVRALISLGDETEEDAEEIANDSDGSIKVALIGIARSISAWRTLQLLGQDKARSIKSPAFLPGTFAARHGRGFSQSERLHQTWL